MIISIRLSDEEKKLADAYSKLNGESLSESIRKAFFEKIEDEYDLTLMDRALEEYSKDKTTYTIEEVIKELKK